MADIEVAADPFQDAWADPEKFHALFIDDKHGFMIIPDARPVVEHHVLVISREAVPYQEMPLDRQLQMMALANLVAEHIDHVLKPKRKIGYAIWGNQIKTAHIHLLPRNLPEDGLKFFDSGRAWATPEQLEATRKLLEFPAELRRKIISKLNEFTAKPDA